MNVTNCHWRARFAVAVRLHVHSFRRPCPWEMCTFPYIRILANNVPPGLLGHPRMHGFVGGGARGVALLFSLCRGPLRQRLAATDRLGLHCGATRRRTDGSTRQGCNSLAAMAGSAVGSGGQTTGGSGLRRCSSSWKSAFPLAQVQVSRGRIRRHFKPL
jgi:hypothetical protein